MTKALTATSKGTRAPLVVLIAVLLGLSSCAMSSQPSEGCLLDLPVYDSVGQRQKFRVVSITPEQRPELNLLASASKSVRSEGSKVWFVSAEEIIGRVVRVMLQDGAGRVASDTVFLTQCPQRHSIRIGHAEIGMGQSNAETITGRLVGCRFDNDWWVRAMPMFGTGGGPQKVFDGYVHSNGDFRISGGMIGERHILVFGRGTQALLSRGFNVIERGHNAMGIVRIRGKCE